MFDSGALIKHRAEQRHNFKPLREGNYEIRVLELLPGPWSSPIRVRIVHEDFRTGDHPRIPSYEALSYVWGDASSPESIHVMEEDRVSTLSVTRNCAEALQCLREVQELPRRLWIDAVCINQKDLHERAQQVSIMAAIYTHAKSVIAWVGGASDDSVLAIKWFESVAAQLGIDAASGWSSFLDVPSKFLDYESRMMIDAEQTRAIDAFMHREYFSRLWIWQEIKLGRSNAILLCGGKTLAWTKFRVGIRHLQGKVLPVHPSPTFLARNSLLRQLVDAPETDLLVALHFMRNCRCTDQRDRIYTAQALQTRPGFSIKPDYTISVAEVYSQSALLSFVKYGRLDLLQYVVQPSVIPDLPSWVPDWSVADKHRWIFFGNADAGSKPSYQELHGALVVKGRMVGTVEGAKAYLLSDSRSSTTIAMAASLRELLGAQDGTPEQNGHVKHMSNLLAAVEPREQCVPPRPGHPSAAEVRTCIHQAITDVSNNTASTEYAIALSYCHQILAGRAMIWCEDNTHAIGSAAATCGDIIAVLLGCDLPVLLRPLEHGRFKLIGHAYCAGTMAGEAILGDLPPGIEAVRAQNADGGYIRAFSNKHNREVQWDDPRMPILTQDWEVVVLAEGRSPPRYRNVNTGEVRGFWEDPRCDVEPLRSRGTAIKTFTII